MRVMLPISLWMVLYLLTSPMNAQTPSTFIHVNQLGYLPNAEKVAVLSDPQSGYNASDAYTPAATIELRDASTDALIFSASGSIWNSGNTHTQSGDKGYWFDFSSVTTPGTYYIIDLVNNERTGDFRIADDVYDDALKAALKMYYYNRCGIEKVAPYAETGWTDANAFNHPLQDANCRFIDDPNNAALEKDLTGGWFDAGDYNKYVTFANSAVHNLLWAYEENPLVFGDDWQIPESGNGLPDILDEIKWELDWLMKMNNSDGSTHIKMGSRNHSENSSAPPSLNTDPRYYGPVCSAASIAVAGMFAHAALVFAQIPSQTAYAQSLETRAVSSWNYVLPMLNAHTLDLLCDDGSIVAGDADWTTDLQKEQAVVAAAYLFALTGESAYSQYVVDEAGSTEPLNTGFWGVYKNELNDALMLYTAQSGADAGMKNTILNSISTAVNNNWNDYFGFSDADLYRAYMPDWSYHWGSSSPKAAYGVMNQLLVNYNINPSGNSAYTKKVAEQLHYFFGVNPQGLVYLTNLYPIGADRCINEIYHIWFADGTIWDNTQTSTYGPAPGFVTGGPNKDFSVTSLSPPHGQPDQKCYLDFNDSWPNNSWEITEPAIYYQAFFVRLLANFAGQSNAPLPVHLINFEAQVMEQQEVRLSWLVEEERQLAGYELERSFDSRRFERIYATSARNSSDGRAHYQMFDREVFKGTLYYRLKMIEQDSRFSYSPVRSVRLSEDLTITISPNPAKDWIALQINSDRTFEGQLVFRTVNGRQLGDAQVIPVAKGREQLSLDISAWTSGVYFLQFHDEVGQLLWTKKLVVD
ncbi:MAG: glycoside hydrolase family 9 protein [Bacteroidota bacterium]